MLASEAGYPRNAPKASRLGIVSQWRTRCVPAIGAVSRIGETGLTMADMLAQNLTQTAPFLNVRDMARSLQFYVDGLGFELKQRWTPDAPDRIRWCLLAAGGGALMLQEYSPGHQPNGELGSGVSICFMCRDALSIYRGAAAKGLSPRMPFVGNGLWVVSLRDPDGYKIDFESPTDLPENTEYEPSEHG